MRIRTQIMITLLLFGIILVIIATSAMITNRQIEKASEQERTVSHIAQGVSEVSYLANDYLIHRENQQLRRWQSRFATFSTQVASLSAERPEQQVLVANIRANQKRLKEVFDSVISTVENPSLNQRAALDPAFLQVSWSRIAVQSQGLISDASRLSRLFRQQTDRLREKRTQLIYVMVGLFGALLLAGYMLTHRRILKSIATLQAGTAVIGSGHLEFIIEEKKNDEIGDLSRAFNRMTADLKTVTASKSDLEREVAERKVAEEKIRRQNKVQEAISRIFEKTLSCDTEEELGRLCLAVVEELTGSKLGFIGEIGRDGYLHDIAISDPGWELCTMYDKTGHRRPPGSFRIQGLYGRVLQDGKSLLTNDPASHPDSIGVPEGHPHLTAFVGMPFIEGGKTIGMVALGNREGGYTQEQQQDLESVAPVILQALLRKRAEEALKKAHRELQEHADRLEAANQELESFSYSVSHDLRSPLRAIAGFTRMILDEKGATFDPETRRKFDIVQDNAQKMGHLIEDLLRLSRLGRAELNRSKLDMGSLVREVLQEIRMTEPEREFTTEISDLPAAHGDPAMVRQLLANLLSNAVKFTREKEGACIEVDSFERSGERVYYVKDNGVGFDMKYYNKLFGVFQRLVSESQFEGTGVGLAIVQRIVQRHGGRVWAEGKIHGGATFYFTLPSKEQG